MRGAVATARAFGIDTIICPYLAPDERPENSAGWLDIAARLAELQRALAGEGFGFAWHNHDFEFARTTGGAIPMEVILENAPGIGWQADIAWIARGGGDPMEWINGWGGRIISVHVKDIAADVECADEDGWADAGEGVMNWPGLMAALRAGAPARRYVIEHDNPNDLERCARRSIANFRNF
jgi:sugar phosphate isomerase/epimerase